MAIDDDDCCIGAARDLCYWCPWRSAEDELDRAGEDHPRLFPLPPAAPAPPPRWMP